MNRLVPETSLNTVLRLRPLSLAIFEEMGLDPYHLPARRLGEACNASGIAWETLVGRLNALPVPAGNSDWKRLPISHLLDFLTQEHRDFIGSVMPAINSDFAWAGERPDYLGALQPMIKAWPAFAAFLIEHMATEESFLFPKILRYAYCARHQRTDPDFSDGSVKVFAAVHLMRNEEKQMAGLRVFLEAAALAGAMEAPGKGVFHMLQSFQARLVEHSRLEREVLFPMAVDLEKRLYDAHIQGGATRIAATDLNFA